MQCTTSAEYLAPVGLATGSDMERSEPVAAVLRQQLFATFGVQFAQQQSGGVRVLHLVQHRVTSVAGYLCVHR